MEQIIVLIIIGIVSSFFKKGKGKTENPATGQSKPFTATGRVPDNPQSKLKEMSKDLYRELQKEMQRTDVEPPSRQLQQPLAPRPVIAAQPVVAPVAAAPNASTTSRAVTERKERPDSSRDRQRHSGRLSAHGAQYQTASTIQTHELMPKNKEDLIKGIVFSEIFGPPKSKR
jgi:septal ring-binding cell division protein DamX